jgi:ABC-2 type transport system permease protein
VAKLEDMPFDPTGLILQTDEESSYDPFERHYGTFFDTLRSQNRFYQLGTLLSPVAGLQLASMALAGNDLEQHRDFIRQAEAHRRLIHTLINDYIPKHAAKNAHGEWEVEAGRELWKSIPAFKYLPPAWEAVLPHYGLGLGLLVVWLTGSAIAACLAVSNLRTN